ncbi:TPA: hypothetical protein HA265_07885 [Candidatus Woesearchaeota archaeon]|nr:hypothetical protein [Candidatus Woesearchaeota archaeon]
MPEHLKETLHILNAREKKPILKAISDQWGVDFRPEVMLMSNKNKVYITTPELNQVEWHKYKVDGVGLYIARMENEVRLSIEGAQLIGPLAKKNVVTVTDEETRTWFRGEDIAVEDDRLKGLSGYVILRNKDDFLGSGKVSGGKILNFVPKGRRITSQI